MNFLTMKSPLLMNFYCLRVFDSLVDCCPNMFCPDIVDFPKNLQLNNYL